MSSTILPQWNNSDEYKGFSAPDFQNDFKFVESNISKINSFTQEYSKNLSESSQPLAESFLMALQQVVDLQTKTKTLFYTRNRTQSLELISN